jgi:hypothetical protein
MEIIHKVYPALNEGFYEILCARIKAHHFTDYELKKAVEHVIDTCKYPVPLVAEFISFMRPDGVIEQIEPELTPEEIEENRVKAEEEEKIYLADRDAFNQRLLNGDFESKEESPREFLKY